MKLVRGALVAAVVAAGLAVVLPPRAVEAHTPHDSAGHVVASPEYATDQTVMVTTEGRLMRTQDGGTTWHPVVNGLPTKDLRVIAFGGPTLERAYLSAASGVFVSGDGGDSWTESLTGTDTIVPWQVVASQVDPDRAALVLIGGGLQITTDGGDTWDPAPGAGQVSALSTSTGAGQDDLLVVGGSDGTIRTSADGGVTFTPPVPVFDDTNIVSIEVLDSPGAEPVIYVSGAAGGLQRSGDGGRTFAPVDAGLAEESVRSIVAEYDEEGRELVWIATHDTGVWASENAGQTWEYRSVGLTSDKQAVTVEAPQFRTLSLTRDAEGQRVLFLAGFDGMFRSTDDGRLWMSQETLGEMITGISISPDYVNDNEVALATYVKGAYLSDDNGDSWRFIADDMRNDRLEAGNEFLPIDRLHNIVHSPDYANDRIMFSATWTRLLRSTDGGESWTAGFVSEPPPDTDLRGFKIAVSPEFATDGTVFLGTRQGEVFRSTDRGAGDSFELMGTVEGEIRSLVVSPDLASDRTLFLGGINGVYRSTDLGASWEPAGPTTTSILTMSPAYSTDRTVFAASWDGLWVTRDAGDTWNEVDLPFGSGQRVEGVGVSPDFASDGLVLASVRSKGLYISRDGGNTFEEIAPELTAQNILITDFITNPSGTPVHFSPNFAEDRTIFAFAENRVLRSEDAAASWEILPVPESSQFPLPDDFQPAPPSTPEMFRPVEIPSGPAPGDDTAPTGPSTDSGGDNWKWFAAALIALVGAAGVYFVRRTGGRTGDDERPDDADADLDPDRASTTS